MFWATFADKTQKRQPRTKLAKSQIQNTKRNNLKLSLIGRKLIINQVMLSKIWYLAHVETPPKHIIQDIKRTIYNFLWNFRKMVA